MAPIYSRPYEEILQDAWSLPCASQLSKGVMSILRHILSAKRRGLPKKTSEGEKVLRRLRLQATSETLSAADAAWLDTFLANRDAWMDHEKLSGFAASSEKEVYCRAFRHFMGEENVDLDAAAADEEEGEEEAQLVPGVSNSGHMHATNGAVLGSAGGVVTLPSMINGSSSTITAGIREADDTAMAATTTGSTAAITTTATATTNNVGTTNSADGLTGGSTSTTTMVGTRSTHNTEGFQQLQEGDEEMEQEPEGMSALLAAVRLQPESRCPAVMDLKRRYTDAVAVAVENRRLYIESLHHLAHQDQQAVERAWDAYFHAAHQAPQPAVGLGKRARYTAINQQQGGAQRVEQLVGSSHSPYETTSWRPPSAAAGGGGAATALAPAGSSSRMPSITQPTPRGPAGGSFFGEDSSCMSVTPRGSKPSPLFIADSSFVVDHQQQQQQQGVMPRSGSTGMGPPPPRGPPQATHSSSSMSDTTASTATADSEGAGVVPQPAGPNPNLSEAEVLVEGLALGSISGQLGPACIEVAGSVACSPKDEDRILLRTLEVVSDGSDERSDQPQLLMAAVMDGHGSASRCDGGRPGAMASTFVARHLPDTMNQLLKGFLQTKPGGRWESDELEGVISYSCKTAFAQLDEQLGGYLQQEGACGGGTTLAMAILAEDKVVVAHVGDSVVVLVKDDTIVWCNRAHDCSDEEERGRVEELGFLGWRGGNAMMRDGGQEGARQQRPCVALSASKCVSHDDWREGLPKLDLTRSLGDFAFKLPVFKRHTRTSAILSEPEVSVLPLEPGGDYLLVLASDGALVGKPFGQEERQASVAGLVQDVQQTAPGTGEEGHSRARALLDVTRAVTCDTQRATLDDSSLILLRFQGPAKA